MTHYVSMATHHHPAQLNHVWYQVECPESSSALEHKFELW